VTRLSLISSFVPKFWPLTGHWDGCSNSHWQRDSWSQVYSDCTIMMGSFMNSKVIGQVINFSISPLIGGGGSRELELGSVGKWQFHNKLKHSILHHKSPLCSKRCHDSVEYP
jgi:hypothetical protein